MDDCIGNENKSKKHKTNSLKATKKYQKKKIYKATNLKLVKKYQAKISEI